MARPAARANSSSAPSFSLNGFFFLVVGCALLASASVHGGGVGVSIQGDAGDTLGVEGLYNPPRVRPFIYYRIPQQSLNPQLDIPLARRDIRFHWSESTYVADGRPLVPDTTLVNDLSRLGAAIAKNKLNPFGYDVPDIQLVHDYFHPGSATYNDNPEETGFLLPMDQPERYADGDRNHVDLYVYYPQIGSTNWGDGLPWPENTGNRGRHPSDFIYAGEDVAEGRPAVVDSALIRHDNSISLAGPRSDSVGVSAWPAPNGGANWVFAHELAHVMAGGSEILASAAEALAGENSDTPLYDHPYDEVLFDGGNGNYTAWRSFSAYLVYNFRGMDRSYAGRGDDLMWRWVRNQGTAPYGVAGLATELIGANCLQCSLTTNRFAGLTPIERVGRLVQDWRVANYVNNPALADSQYGFPAHLFNPMTEVGNWVDRDPLLSNNGTTVPPGWTVTPSWSSPRWFSNRPAGPGFAARRLALKNVSGTEYFVFHADPALDGSRDLELRVVSDAIVRSESYSGSCSPSDAARGVLWVSAVRYAQDDASLFLHPEYATEVLNTRLVLDSLRSGATLVVPGFGSSTKAVVVVATLWRQGTMRTFAPLLGGAAAPIAIQARLRPAQSSAPARIVATAGQHDDAPAWSADGSEIAFASKIPSTATYSQIFRVSSAGGTPAALATASRNQRNPDWSPRGDYVVYEQDAPGLSKSDIWIHDLSAATSAALVSKSRASTFPVFQPNGRLIAYRYSASASTWQIRKVGVDGSGDSLVVELSTAPQSLRWSPDGLWLWYSVRDSIAGSSELIDMPYTVSRNGGTPIKRADLVEASRGALSIAIHQGGSWALCEQTGQTYWGVLSCSFPGCGCPFPSEGVAPVPVRRAQLRDLATGDAITPFQDVTTCRQYFPRFAPDGIRIAYSQNDSNATSSDRDIIVRKLGDHSPPVFSSPPGDLTLESGPGTAIDLDATDLESLAITYQGVQLPADSWINSVSGVFSWPQPSAGAVAYPVLRALDASGGVATVIPKLTIVQGFAPSAVGGLVGNVTTSSAILMEWSAPGDDSSSGTATQYEIRRSPNPITEGNFASATPVDAPAPQVAGSWQTQWVSGLQPTTWYYLAIRTRDEAHNWGPISVVHSRTAPSGGGGNGESAQNAGDRVDAAGEGRTAALGATSGSVIGAQAAAPLALEVRMTGGVPGLSVHRADAGAAADGIAIEALDALGSWTRLAVAADPGVGSLTVHQRRDGARRYLLPGSYALTRIAANVTTGTSAGLSMTAAENSRTGSLEPARDLQSPAMEPGDTLRASYALTESPAARAEDWLVLLTRGAAVSGNSSDQTASGVPLPVAFALHQSQPNPFSRDVTIAFDLPREAAVKIEVHDLQGRLVARLADGVRHAGRHTVKWNRSSHGGGPLPAGVYLYSMTAGSFRAQKKMIALP